MPSACLLGDGAGASLACCALTRDAHPRHPSSDGHPLHVQRRLANERWRRYLVLQRVSEGGERENAQEHRKEEEGQGPQVRASLSSVARRGRWGAVCSALRQARAAQHSIGCLGWRLAFVTLQPEGRVDGTGGAGGGRSGCGAWSSPRPVAGERTAPFRRRMGCSA